MDSNPKRFSLISRNVHSALSTYKQAYDKKETNQIIMDAFLKRVTHLLEKLQAGSSGRIQMKVSSQEVTAPSVFLS
jgi:hypothetical protein